MRDDTGEGMSALGVDDLEKVKGLWKFQVHRTRAQVWANRDIKFLVYDDTEDDDSKTRKGSKSPVKPTDSFGLGASQSQPGPSTLPQSPPEVDEDVILQQAILESLKPNDSVTNQPPATDAGLSVGSQTATEDEGMDDPDIQEAIRISLMSDDDSSGIPSRAQTEASGPQTSADAGDDDFECRICSSLPTFPHNRKTRKFRLFNPSDEFPHIFTKQPKSVDICVHYVAVSYCWPEPVRNEEGKIIQPKVESQVRDLNGVPRPARALDDVLDRAVDVANSCGLRMIWIDQECLPQPDDSSAEEDKRYQQLGVQAMDIVYNRAIVTAGLHASKITSQAQIDAIKTLVAFGDDNRHSLSLSPQLFDNILQFLQMVRLDRWYTRAWVVQEALSAGNGLALVFRRAPGLVYQSKLRADRKKYMTPRHPLDSEERGVESEIICIPVDDFRSLVQTAKLLLESRFQAIGQALVRTNTAFPRILSIAESLHPSINVRTDSSGIHMYGGNIYGGRLKVNAATALTLLNSRDCRDVQDRLAIVANMCSYEIRLDTDKVAKNCDSLRLGLLAIALLNGDTSILVPEVYHFPGDEDGEPDPLIDNRAGRLLSPFDTDLKRINHYAVQDGKLVNPQVYKHAIGDTSSKGLHLSAYIWTVDDSLDLSPLKYHYAETWHRMKCLRMVVERQKEESQDNFVARRGMITQHFSKRHIMDRAKMELFHNGSIAPDSAVWGGLNSAGVQVRAYLDAYRVEAVPEMQRIVAEIFFAILRYLNNMSSPQSIGVANSIWQSIRVDVVDKPQTNHRIDLPDFVGEELFSHPDVLQIPFQTLHLDKDRGGGYHQAWIIDRVMQHGALWVGKYNRATDVPSGFYDNKSKPSEESLEQQGGIRPERKFKSKNPDTIIYRQLQRRLLATLYSAGLGGNPDALEDNATMVNAASMAWLAEAVKRDLFTAEAENARARELASTFNVDGPCVVATPFNPDWEVLPRPDLRCMSICWVVEDVHNRVLDESGKTNEVQRETLVSVGGKGKEPERPLEASFAGQGKSTDEGGSKDVESAKVLPLYQVLDKVKGMWQIMDLPMQNLSFI